MCVHLCGLSRVDCPMWTESGSRKRKNQAIDWVGTGEGTLFYFCSGPKSLRDSFGWHNPLRGGNERMREKEQ